MKRCQMRNSEIGVPVKEDIYEYLRNLLDSEQVIPIFMLSDNYYDCGGLDDKKES